MPSNSIHVILFSHDAQFLVYGSDAQQKLHTFRREGVEVSVFVLSKTKRGDRGESERDLDVNGYGGNVLVRSWYAYCDGLRRARALKEQGRKVLIVAQDPLMSGWIAYGISRRLNVPFEVQQHGDFFSGAWGKMSLVHGALLPLMRFVLHRAVSIRAVSERIRDRNVRMGMHPDRIYVLPIGIDISSLISLPIRDMQCPPTFVTPARFVREKRLDVLIEAYVHLKKCGEPFHAKVIGKGPYKRRLRRWIIDAGLQDCVEIVNWMPKEALWKSGDLLVFSSESEGYGLVLAEAMAAGIPIVTTDVGCVGSVVRPQIDARVVPPADPVALAHAIREQMMEPERRAWMARNARERAQSFLDTHAALVALAERWKRII